MTVEVLGFAVPATLVASTEAIVLEVDGLGLEDSVEVCKVEVFDGSTSLGEVLFDELLVLLVELVADTGGKSTSGEWVVLAG